MNIHWTPEMDAIVVKHYREGCYGKYRNMHTSGLTAAEIAALLKTEFNLPFTEGSVTGRWKRKLKHAVRNSVAG